MIMSSPKRKSNNELTIEKKKEIIDKLDKGGCPFGCSYSLSKQSRPFIFRTLFRNENFARALACSSLPLS